MTSYMRITGVSTSCIILISLLAAPTAFSDDGAGTGANAGFDVDPDYRGGNLRLGAFAIGNISARLYFGPDDLAIAVPIDIEKDLGFQDSELAVGVLIGIKLILDGVTLIGVGSVAKAAAN